MDDLTIEHLHSGEWFANDLFDFSGGFEESKPLLVRAHERAEQLAAHPTSPHSEKVQGEIREYFARLYEGL
jgi:hypothetical protein